MTRSKRIVIGTMAAAAAVAVLASSAYACVVFKGDLTVVSPGTSGNRVTGSGDLSSMRYCTGRQPTTAGSAGAGDSILVTVSLATACVSTTNKLPEGDARVILTNAATTAGAPFSYIGGKWNVVHSSQCGMSNSSDNFVLSTAYAVDALGAGADSFTLPSLNRVDPTNVASDICVAKGSFGISAPLRVTHI